MAHVPGQVVELKDDVWGTTCDNHDTVPAIKRICSEADSFGAEYMNFCQSCWDNHQQALKEKEEDPTQWDSCPECKKSVPRLISYRDTDEGMHGPVYEHCEDCHSVMNARIAEEDAYYDDDDYFYDQEDHYEPEPHYEDLVESDFQLVADYIKREHQLQFEIKKKDNKKTAATDLSLIIKVTGKKAYKRLNKRFQSFANSAIDNGHIDIPELKQAICYDGSDIEVSILNHRISDRKIEGAKLIKPLSLAELLKLAQDRPRTKRIISKEFITPVYAIELILAKVYWS